MVESSGWGVGVDIEEVGKFRKALTSSRRFISRTFSKEEIGYCMSKGDPAVHFAGIFAAKEAAYKATSRLLRGKVEMIRFEITHDRNGIPSVRYNGRPSSSASVEIRTSVSHTLRYAVAVAFALKKNSR